MDMKLIFENIKWQRLELKVTRLESTALVSHFISEVLTAIPGVLLLTLKRQRDTVSDPGQMVTRLNSPWTLTRLWTRTKSETFVSILLLNQVSEWTPLSVLTGTLEIKKVVWKRFKWPLKPELDSRKTTASGVRSTLSTPSWSQSNTMDLKPSLTTELN